MKHSVPPDARHVLNARDPRPPLAFLLVDPSYFSTLHRDLFWRDAKMKEIESVKIGRTHYSIRIL